jgi:hypothetical protein
MSSNAVESTASSSSTRPTSDSATSGDQDPDVTRRRAETFQLIANEVKERKLDISLLLSRLRAAGASPEEAKDYFEQAKQHLTREGRTSRESSGQRRTVDEPELEETMPESHHAQSAADEVDWAQLQARLMGDRREEGESLLGQTTINLDDLAKLFELAKPKPPTIPASVLAIAPHLAQYSQAASSDAHIERTWMLRKAYATEKATDAIIDLMQRNPMPDPLPRSIWRHIVLDEYVDFEKLYAGMGRGYDQDDEPKDFPGGYAIVKKEHFKAKRPVVSEADWNRIARAWKTGVELLYPHRKTELDRYILFVEELFRAAPKLPSVAISFDAEARDKYARCAYRMDDRNELNLPILTQMFRASASSNLGKRPNTNSASFTSNKRSVAVCRNWNLGYCSDAECPNRRIHKCHECGGAHRAKDKPDCFDKFRASRRPQSSTA